MLYIDLGPGLRKTGRIYVTTGQLGKSRITGLTYENPDTSPVKLKDYLGNRRSKRHPCAGPFETTLTGTLAFRVWSSP